MPSVIYPVERDACVDESPSIIPPATAPLLPISNLLPDVHVAFSRCLCFANGVSFHPAANAPPQTGGTRATLRRHSGDNREQSATSTSLSHKCTAPCTPNHRPT